MEMSKIRVLVVEDESLVARDIQNMLRSLNYEVLGFPWPIADIVVQHHERLDGSGYPAGLKGGAILPEANILIVADVVEAMSSHRPYRPAHGIDKAIAEITQNKGVLYDAAVVDHCVRLFKEKGFSFE
jgi:HD-GYP domain-containing protein (c-di-GMP phosphodiesterase class II)